MTSKITTVCLSLISTCPILCVIGYGDLGITEKKYAAFKGVDPTASCGDIKAMQDVCNRFGKSTGYTDGTIPFAQGYPQCFDSNVVLQTSCGGTTLKKAKFMTCCWSNYSCKVDIGKGKDENHIMNYACDMEAHKCTPYHDIMLKKCS